MARNRKAGRCLLMPLFPHTLEKQHFRTLEIRNVISRAS